jgi:hypothetical protein
MTKHSLDIGAVKAVLGELYIGITDVDEAFNEIWGEFGRRSVSRGRAAVSPSPLPAHHAVYDTRTHFVVPRDEVPEWACQRCGGYGLISLPCENGFADGPCPDCDGQGVRTSESEVSR